MSSLIAEALTVASGWSNESLHCRYSKPQRHLELIVLELIPMIPILSAHTLICRSSNILLLKPLRTLLYIFAILWNSCSSSGGAQTCKGTIYDRVVLGRHQSFLMALRQAVLKPVILFESNCQIWEPNRWQHFYIKLLMTHFYLHVWSSKLHCSHAQ